MQIPVVVENDANAAALGEHAYGIAANVKDFIFLSLGTGVGAGLFADGRLLTGCRGAAGEVGHMVMHPEGPTCSCGGQGCLEALAGGWAILRDARAAVNQGQATTLRLLASRGELIDVKAVADAALQHDTVAQQILNNALSWLGLGVANVVNLLNPELVVMGGGLSLMGEPLLAAVRGSVARHAMPVQRATARIELSRLGDRAGVLGAVELARQLSVC
jgi:glucokinase